MDKRKDYKFHFILNEKHFNIKTSLLDLVTNAMTQ